MAAGTTTWDVRLEELHGLPPGGFGGTFEDWLASLHPEDRAECLARVERALASPGPYVLLHRTIWRDGSVHYIECRGTVLTDEIGAPTGTTGVAIDVTDREQHRVATSEALARERDLVGVLQQALLPTSLPEVPGTTIGVRYIPAQSDAGVGGDWYAAASALGWPAGLGNRRCRRPRGRRGRRHGGRTIQLARTRAHRSGRTRARARTTQQCRARVRERHDDHCALWRVGPGRPHVDLRQRGPLPGIGAQA